MNPFVYGLIFHKGFLIMVLFVDWFVLQSFCTKDHNLRTYLVRCINHLFNEVCPLCVAASSWTTWASRACCKLNNKISSVLVEVEVQPFLWQDMCHWLGCRCTVTVRAAFGKAYSVATVGHWWLNDWPSDGNFQHIECHSDVVSQRTVSEESCNFLTKGQFCPANSF